MVACEQAKMVALLRDVAYVKRLTPQQRLDEFHVSLMNAITILPTIADRESSFNSAINSMKAAVNANEMKCNIEAGKKYDEWKSDLIEVRNKLRQAELEKKTLELDIGDYDKKIADLEQRVIQIEKEA
ncbi:hypothetical protein ACH5RR_037133 [Cinchona calisaya]|uniref:Uncharacterized protein n=1 Tax=Cinchona calisaya TaxID=153742 RepID=A0ABD2Y9M5_9GENT